MKIKYLLSFLISAICISLFSSSSYSMTEEETIDPSYSKGAFRIQIYSYLNSQGIEDGHKEFDRLAEKAPLMKNYPAYIVHELKSKWNRGHLVCADALAAQTLAEAIGPVLGNGTHVVAPGTVTKNQDLTLKFAIRHVWPEC
jgi:hypothetical protein